MLLCMLEVMRRLLSMLEAVEGELGFEVSKLLLWQFIRYESAIRPESRPPRGDS